MIAPASPRAPVGSREERVDFGVGEEGHEPPLEAFRRNRQHARDRGGVLRMANGRKAKQRADGGEPRVARANAIPVLVFTMIEERTDQRGVELRDIQVRGLHRLAHGRKAHQ